MDSMLTRIALVGDFDPKKIAHQAIAECFALARTSVAPGIEPIWMATKDIVPGLDGAFAKFQGIWCVPGSPYANADVALWAITCARTQEIPFLGTCGGVQ